jgi:MoxR-like ATPase
MTTTTEERLSEADASWFAECFNGLVANIELAIRGKREVIRLALTCMLTEGHLLLEDVPGVGKTSLARAISASVGLTWKRIQFTPDLLPSDVTGVTIFNQGQNSFEFHPGAVFANIVVGDEINRASPKTQSSLLEVMEERQVTVDGVAYPVPRPFMVIATQNPVDMDGTYHLPEAQLDRFLMRASIGYPDRGAEVDIIASQQRGSPVDDLRAVANVEYMERLIELAHTVFLAPALEGYVVDLVHATRDHPSIRLGVSPRGSLAISKSARTWAAGQGRPFVTADDIGRVAEPVLAHRIILTPEAELQGRTASQVVREIIESQPVPQSVSG